MDMFGFCELLCNTFPLSSSRVLAQLLCEANESGGLAVGFFNKFLSELKLVENARPPLSLFIVCRLLQAGEEG